VVQRGNKKKRWVVVKLNWGFDLKMVVVVEEVGGDGGTDTQLHELLLKWELGLQGHGDGNFCDNHRQHI
jgi:hypothetical protein